MEKRYGYAYWQKKGREQLEQNKRFNKDLAWVVFLLLLTSLICIVEGLTN